MRRPFLVRVLCDDAATARGIAGALAPPLEARGARVVFEGMQHDRKAAFNVHVLTGARGLPGVSLLIGVWDEDQGARWLAPLEVSEAPELAAREVVEFLEAWGFVTTPAPRPVSPSPLEN